MRLHKEHGVNPRLTFCPQCGGEGNELVLLGAHDSLYRCIREECGAAHIGRPEGGSCAKCGATVRLERKIGQHERIPGGICDACQEKNRQVEEEVARGGIHWRCADCGAAGAIRAGHPLAEAVRAQMGIAAPNACGVEFTRVEGCPACGEEGESDGSKN